MDMNEVDEDEFGFSRNYFLAKELRGSVKKSSQKLSDLNIVDEQELREAGSKLVTKHEKEIISLKNSYKSLYSKWVFELRSGFGLLFYGFGSKKVLIEDFATTTLTDSAVVVINGYLQSVNLKHVVTAMAELLWDRLKLKRRTSLGSMHKTQQPSSSQSMEDLLAFLDGSHSEKSHCCIYVVVHNIDGPGLREIESQQTLARIASCSLVRMIASIDHVNAPLLWDKKMVHTQFNWSWYHVPTFEPYKVEGLFFPLILAHGGTAQSAKTAVIVLQSLHQMHKVYSKFLQSINWLILTKKASVVAATINALDYSIFLDAWMPTNNLYTICREKFLVSSQMTLNSHLTEFKDHELVKTRRHSDGQDCFYIPLTSDALERLLQEIG